MIIQQTAPRTRRTSFAQAARNEKTIAQSALGRQVMIVVAGIYNGPNHKSLGWIEAGDLVTVAVGPYADSLIQDGLAVPFDGEVEIPSMVMESPSPSPQAEGPVADAWRSFLEAGVTEKVAKALTGAGIAGRDDLTMLIASQGVESLLSISGVGQSAVRKLAAWAEA